MDRQYCVQYSCSGAYLAIGRTRVARGWGTGAAGGQQECPSQGCGQVRKVVEYLIDPVEGLLSTGPTPSSFVNSSDSTHYRNSSVASKTNSQERTLLASVVLSIEHLILEAFLVQKPPQSRTTFFLPKRSKVYLLNQ